MSWFVSSSFSNSVQITPQTRKDYSKNSKNSKNSSSTAKVDSVNTIIGNDSAYTLQDNNMVIPLEKKSSEEKKLPQYTIEEIKKHDNENSCWIVLYGKVHDMTPVLYRHPGGSSILLKYGGTRNMYEAEYVFEMVPHSHKQLKKYVIGTFKA